MKLLLDARLFTAIPVQAPIDGVTALGYALLLKSIPSMHATTCKQNECYNWVAMHHAAASTLFRIHYLLQMGIILGVGLPWWFLGAYRQSMWARIINVN